jgi:hypothetical protein
LEPLPHPSIPKVKKYDYAVLKFRDMTLEEITEDYPDICIPEEHKAATVPIEVYARIDKTVKRIEQERQAMSFDSMARASNDYSRCVSNEAAALFDHLTKSSHSVSADRFGGKADSKISSNVKYSENNVKNLRSNQYFLSK